MYGDLLVLTPLVLSMRTKGDICITDIPKSSVILRMSISFLFEASMYNRRSFASPVTLSLLIFSLCMEHLHLL